MKRSNQIIYLMLGIFTLILIELSPQTSYGFSRLLRKSVKGTMVVALKDITLSIEKIEFVELIK